jgi:outer membrane protein assembly factor BamB
VRIGQNHSDCRSLAALVIVAVCLFTLPSRAEDWPSWRGPNGTGVTDAKGWPENWSNHQNVRWRVPLPDRGNSSPIVSGDCVFVTQAIENDHRRTLMCFAKSDGRLLWQTGVTYPGHEPSNGENPYCSASPVTDGTRVIAYFGSAGLYCYDFQGKEIWRRDVGKVDSWQGSGSSPIIHDGLCFLNAGPGTTALVLACDVKTGQVVWSVKPPKVPGAAIPRAKPPATRGTGFDDAMLHADPTGAGGFLGSWCTPLILRTDDHEELIVVHPLQVSAYEPGTGREIWACKDLPAQAFGSPMVADDALVVTGHRVIGGGTRVTAIKLGGKGDLTATNRLWQLDLPKECVGSGVIADGHVYLVTQFGSVVCIDLASGKKLSEKRLSGQGSRSGSWSSIVLADGKMLIPNHAGETFVIAPAPEFSILATNSIGDETTCSSPALSDGCIFLRTYKALWCFAR